MVSVLWFVVKVMLLIKLCVFERDCVKFVFLKGIVLKRYFYECFNILKLLFFKYWNFFVFIVNICGENCLFEWLIK